MPAESGFEQVNGINSNMIAAATTAQQNAKYNDIDNEIFQSRRK